jgi:hypothetical protein
MSACMSLLPARIWAARLSRAAARSRSVAFDATACDGRARAERGGVPRHPGARRVRRGRLFSLGIGGTIASGIERALCEITGAERCGSGDQPEPAPPPAPPPPTVDPQLTPDERDLLLGDPQGAQEILDGLSEAERRWLERNDPQAAQAVDEAISWEEERAIVDAYIDAPSRTSWPTATSRATTPVSTSRPTSARRRWWAAPGPPSTSPTPACAMTSAIATPRTWDSSRSAKSEIDRRFYEDMKDHCATRSAFLQASCYGWARRFYAGVVAFG